MNLKKKKQNKKKNILDLSLDQQANKASFIFL